MTKPVQWTKAQGPCGFNLPTGTPVQTAYVNRVALFAFPRSWLRNGIKMTTYNCVVTGHMACGGNTLEEAQQKGIKEARECGINGADQRMTRKEFDELIAIPYGCPYTYPATTTDEKKAYILNRQRYERNHDGFWPLAWDVKVHQWDPSGHSGEAEGPITPALDEEWREYVESRDYIHDHAIEEARRNSQTIDGDYCTYPGDDQGAWKFAFYGRSGGWLVLTHWEPKSGPDVAFGSMYREEWRDYVNEEMTDQQIDALYRALRCMDQDFKEPTHYINDAYAQLRYEWESERTEPANVSHVGNDVEPWQAFKILVKSWGTLACVVGFGESEEDRRLAALEHASELTNRTITDFEIVETL